MNDNLNTTRPNRQLVAHVVNARVSGCNVSADVSTDIWGNGYVSITVARNGNVSTVNAIVDTDTYSNLACAIADAHNDETGDCIADAFTRVGARAAYAATDKLALQLATIAADNMRDSIMSGNENIKRAVLAHAMRGAFGAYYNAQ